MNHVKLQKGDRLAYCIGALEAPSEAIVLSVCEYTGIVIFLTMSDHATHYCELVQVHPQVESLASVASQSGVFKLA